MSSAARPDKTQFRALSIVEENNCCERALHTTRIDTIGKIGTPVEAGDKAWFQQRLRHASTLTGLADRSERLRQPWA